MKKKQITVYLEDDTYAKIVALTQTEVLNCVLSYSDIGKILINEALKARNE